MSQAEAAPRLLSPVQARNVLIAVTFVNLFNYIDRYIVPPIADALKTSLHLNDTQLGLLATGFIMVYAIASPRFGEWGDRRHRPRLIALGVMIWSVATALGGFAVGFLSLFVARAIVGVGEAAYGSITPSLLADSFSRARRGRVFAVFYMAIPVGSALGFLIGGFMLHFGWRSAFLVVGAPGVVLAMLLLKLPEAPRGAQDADNEYLPHPARPAGGERWATYAGLLRNRQYLTTVLGYAAYTFAIGALAWWMPSFLGRVHGIPQESAAYLTGTIAVVTGIIGTFAGGWLGDYLLTRTRHAYLLMSGIATLIAVPFAVLALRAHDLTYAVIGLIVAQLLMFASTGPINSAIVNYVAPTERATAMALSILLMHLLGDAPSPWIVGWISTAGTAAGLTEGVALQHALMILPAAILIGGVIWTAGGLRKSS